MSLTDKVIKNTFWYFLSQIAGFIFPLVLTPFIISKIGTEQFGLYALMLGFVGTFSLLDFSISTSFIKFISEYYNKKDFLNLNRIINTGFLFYALFALILTVIGFFLTDYIVSLFKISPELKHLSIYALRMSLLMFFITNSMNVFSSVLISLQMMYKTSLVTTVINLLNFIAVIILLNYGYGLIGLLWSQFAAVSLNVIVTAVFAFSAMPVMKFGLAYFNRESLKKMSIFGLQMQVSKLASFASEKYEEFLLAFFSVLSNVTYYNIAGRIVRVGRFLPFQLVPQVAPVAAELNAREDKAKLKQLFSDTSKYLLLAALPVFLYIFIYADIIIETWMGQGYEVSVLIIRILVAGQLVNMVLSAPGNSITPNIGYPKYQMYEGLINLGINLVLSYIFIKYYGIIGAAYGNATAMIISSLYIFVVSTGFFKESKIKFISSVYFKPLLSGILSAVLSYAVLLAAGNLLEISHGRIRGGILLVLTSGVFFTVYVFAVINAKYLNERDKYVIARMMIRLIPGKVIKEKTQKPAEKSYNGELISICVLTYNRVGMLKKCLNSLIPSLNNINYEIIVWDNGSDDGTRDFLREYEGTGNVKTVLNDSNIGTKAKGLAVEMAKGDYIIGIDDDVIKFPDNWVQDMVYAYNNIPFMGYLAADVEQDEMTDGAKQPLEQYTEEIYLDEKIILQTGPTGGWCYMISREVYKEVGKFWYPKNRIFFADDKDYGRRCYDKGLKTGILKDVKVYHATGFVYNKDYKDIYDAKNKDYIVKDPFLYRLKVRFRRFFSLRFYLRRLIEFAGRGNNVNQ